MKPTFCIYGLHSLHRQFSNFQFFTYLLKALIVVSFSFQQESYPISEGPGMKCSLYHEKHCESLVLRILTVYVGCKHYFVLQKPHSLMGSPIYLIP